MSIFHLRGIYRTPLMSVWMSDGASEVRVDGIPLRYRRNDVECYEFVAHLAEVLIGCVEFGDFLRCACRHLESAAVLVEDCVHGHHDVVIFVSLHICASRVLECLSAHDGTNHFD